MAAARFVNGPNGCFQRLGRMRPRLGFRWSASTPLLSACVRLVRTGRRSVRRKTGGGGACVFLVVAIMDAVGRCGVLFSSCSDDSAGCCCSRDAVRSSLRRPVGRMCRGASGSESLARRTMPHSVKRARGRRAFVKLHMRTGEARAWAQGLRRRGSLSSGVAVRLLDLVLEKRGCVKRGDCGRS